MTRDEAYELLKEMMSNQNLIKHGLAVEAIMRGLCREMRLRHPELVSGSNDKMLNQVQHDKLEEFDEEEWAIVGLLHDADYELVEKDPKRHTLVTEEKLRPLGVSDRIINGIKAHHDGIKKGRDNFLEKAVYAADDMSGLITAVALVRPDKKLNSVTEESVLKKFKTREFAKGAKREQILKGIDELEISLEEFVRISLKSMQSVSKELGL